MGAENWPYVLNLGNSIIGVAVLAMPFCFKQCGIVLGILLLLFCTWLTLVSCQLLMKAGVVSRKRSYEFLAYYTFGAAGKLVIEVCMIGLQLGTLVAQVVIIGDLGPAIVSKFVGFENTWTLRSYLIVFLCLCVGLPLGLLKDLRKVSRASTICICFYAVFVFYVLTLSRDRLWTGEWYAGVRFWRPEGLFQTLPIFSFSFGCQTQLFFLYDSLPEPTLKAVNGVISSAVNLCAVAYLLVGFFGYIAFHENDIGGDIITLFPDTFSADLIKLCFVVSTAVTFPLIIYPCRASLYTLLFHQKHKHEDIQDENHIPEFYFVSITVGIVVFSMVVGILVPNVEFILGMNGATMGSLICYIFPALFFLRVMAQNADGKNIAKLVMVLGMGILLFSTFTTLYSQDKGHTHPVDPKAVLDKPVEQPFLDKPINMPPVDTDSKNEKRMEPPVPDPPLETPGKKEKEVPKNNNSAQQPKPPDKVEVDKTKKSDEVAREKKSLDKEDNPGTVKEKNVKAEVATAGVVEKKEALVEAKAEVLKEREEKIIKNEEKQKLLLDKLVEQQAEQKQLINEQKELLKELKDHKKEHQDETGMKPQVAGMKSLDQQQAQQQPLGQQAQQQPLGQQAQQQPVGQQAQQQPLGKQAQQQPLGQQAQQQPLGQQAQQQPLGQQAQQQPVGQQAQQQPLGKQAQQQPLGQQAQQQPLGQQAQQQPLSQQQAQKQPPFGQQGQLQAGQQQANQPVFQQQAQQHVPLGQQQGQQEFAQQQSKQQHAQQQQQQLVVQKPAQGQQDVQQFQANPNVQQQGANQDTGVNDGQMLGGVAGQGVNNNNNNNNPGGLNQGVGVGNNVGLNRQKRGLEEANNIMQEIQSVGDGLKKKGIADRLMSVNKISKR